VNGGESTRGIARAVIGTPLGILQTNPTGCNGSELQEAARDVATYHAPDADQAQRHRELSEALEAFLVAVAVNTPPGPERSTAISRAREAKMWASAAIALEPRE
jgi:hypothetical protein